MSLPAGLSRRERVITGDLPDEDEKCAHYCAYGWHEFICVDCSKPWTEQTWRHAQCPEKEFFCKCGLNRNQEE